MAGGQLEGKRSSNTSSRAFAYAVGLAEVEGAKSIRSESLIVHSQATVPLILHCEAQ